MLYFEPQQSALCGVHALNTLLQGPFFSETGLAEIALTLDAREREVMSAAGTHTAEYLAAVAEPSGNVSLDGNFSIQVLDCALSSLGLTCSPWARRLTAGRNPLTETAFLCNLEAHWFTLRRLGACWWKFNSLEAAPNPVSDLLLALTLEQLQADGYTIHVVRGDWRPESSLYGAPSPNGLWLSPEQAAARLAADVASKAAGRSRVAAKRAFANASGGRLQLRAWGGAGDAGDDPELAQALAASLGEEEPRVPVGKASLAVTFDDDLARAIRESLCHAANTAAGVDVALAIEASQAVEPASQRRKAIPAPPGEAATLKAEPPSDALALTLAVRLLTGGRFVRRYLSTDPLSDVFLALAANGTPAGALATGFPPCDLAPATATLAELGLLTGSLLIAHP